MTCISALLPVGVAMLGYDIMVYAVYYVLLYSLTFIVATNKCYMHFAKKPRTSSGSAAHWDNCGRKADYF